MRGLTTRFALGALLLGTLCVVANEAQAGPFRNRGARRAAAYTNACCETGYVSPVGMYSAPAVATPVQPMPYAPATVGYVDPCSTQQYVGYSGGAYRGAYRGGLFARGYRNYPQSYTYSQPVGMPMPYTTGYPPSGIVPAGGIVPGQLPTRPADAIPGETNPAEAKAVKITDGTFEPADLNIPVGATVKWTNDGKKPHTVTADKGDWGSGQLAAGQTFTATFTKAGTFEYHCRLHPDMKAKITVK